MSRRQAYRGYEIEYRPAAFTVEAIAKNGRGQTIATANGADQDDAAQSIRNRIDFYLEGDDNWKGGNYDYSLDL